MKELFSLTAFSTFKLLVYFKENCQIDKVEFPTALKNDRIINMEKKKIIGIIIIVSLLIILAFRTIFKKAEDGFVFAEAKIANVP